MTEHVLECRWESRRCICEELRACEQRVTERWESLRGWGESYAYKTGSDNGFLIGYSAALNAAEAAVAHLRKLEPTYYVIEVQNAYDLAVMDAVAAIRALKEKP